MSNADFLRSKPVRSALLQRRKLRCCVTWPGTRCAMWLAFRFPRYELYGTAVVSFDDMQQRLRYRRSKASWLNRCASVFATCSTAYVPSRPMSTSPRTRIRRRGKAARHSALAAQAPESRGHRALRRRRGSRRGRALAARGRAVGGGVTRLVGARRRRVELHR